MTATVLLCGWGWWHNTFFFDWGSESGHKHHNTTRELINEKGILSVIIDGLLHEVCVDTLVPVIYARIGLFVPLCLPEWYSVRRRMQDHRTQSLQHM
jgi:hypothetical protein